MKTTQNSITAGAVFVILLGLWIPRWFLIEYDMGKFIDEVYNVLAPLNWLRFGLYSPVASATIGYEESVSSGIATTWPAAVGWILSGTLFGSRMAFMLWHLFLALVLGFLAARRLGKLNPGEALVFAMVSYFGLYVCIPYTQALGSQILGELGGALLLGIGMTQVFLRPRLCAVLLGIAVWHAKFIYLPFALVAIAAQAMHVPSGQKSKRLATDLVYMQIPLILWWIVICITAGFGGFAKYLVGQTGVFFHFLFGYSGVTHDFVQEPVRGLFNRLNSTELNWHFYAASDKYKIVIFTFLPLVLLLGTKIQTRAKILAFGLAGAIACMALWYFFFHHKMWIRHYDGSLMVSYGVFVAWVLLQIEELRRRQSKILAPMVMGVLSIIIVRESLRLPTWLSLKNTKDYTERYSKQCRSDSPWTIPNQALIDKCFGPQ